MNPAMRCNISAYNNEKYVITTFSQDPAVDISVLFNELHPTRAGSMVGTFIDIAEQAFGDFLDESAQSESDPDKRKASGIKTIVFSAMAIEAAAFEYSASILGDKVAQDYMDKMDLEGKWMIGTRLAYGQSLDIAGPAINGLRSLVKARNILVHHKSQKENTGGTIGESAREGWHLFEKNHVPNAFKTLVLLSLELEASPGGIFGSFLYIDKSLCPPGFINRYSPHPRVKKVINRCREIHRNYFLGRALGG